MKYSCYLEAFCRSYSRRTARGRDNVQYRYSGDYRVTFWSYNNQVIAIVVSREYNGTRYLLLRAPSGKSKSKKAIVGRLDSILLRYSGDHYKDRSDWKNGSLLLYLPGQNRRDQTLSVPERLRQIWNA
jgi:hypothetical protein